MATRPGGRVMTAVGTGEIMVGRTVTVVGIEEIMVGKAGTGTEEIGNNRGWDGRNQSWHNNNPAAAGYTQGGNGYNHGWQGNGNSGWQGNNSVAEPRPVGPPPPAIPRAKAPAALAGGDITPVAVDLRPAAPRPAAHQCTTTSGYTQGQGTSGSGWRGHNSGGSGATTGGTTTTGTTTAGTHGWQGNYGSQRPAGWVPAIRRPSGGRSGQPGTWQGQPQYQRPPFQGAQPQMRPGQPAPWQGQQYQQPRSPMPQTAMGPRANMMARQPSIYGGMVNRADFSAGPGDTNLTVRWQRRSVVLPLSSPHLN